MEKPPLGSILYAVEVPPQGGDTLFSCMYRAFDALPDDLKNKLDGKFGINSSRKAAAAVTRTARIDDSPGEKKDEVFHSRHPIVRTHPETGKKSLYCSDAHTVAIEGMDESESADILNQLYAEQQREEFIYRFQWQRGSVAFWDNRCTQHNAMNDYHGHRRVMLRVTIEGDVP
jgi:taurine dioxygenase